MRKGLGRHNYRSAGGPQPSLVLDFAGTGTLDPRVTFSRSTTAPYYDGKTSVLAEQNLLLQSNTFSNAAWMSQSSIGTPVQNAIAPDGTTTAWTLTATAGAGAPGHVFYQNAALSVGTYTQSFYLQAGTTNFAILTSNLSNVSYISIPVNLTLGSVSLGTPTTTGAYTYVSSSISQVGSTNWYRVVLTYSVSSSGTSSITVQLSNTATPTIGSYGTYSWTAAGTETLLVYGAQLEQRSSVTAYNATTTTALTNYIPQLLTAPINAPRFDFNPTTGESLGLLIEQSSTNLLTYSQLFSDSTWVKIRSSITQTAGIAPDGTQTAQLLIEDTTVTNSHGCGNYGSQTITSGQQYTWSVEAKAWTRNYITLSGDIGNGWLGNGVQFSLIDGTVQKNSSALVTTSTNLGNGWWRFSITATASASGNAKPGVYIGSVPATGASNGVDSYTGNGYSGIYIWGAQLEALAFPTSYIATTSAQVTRASDNASMTGTNFSSWFNQGQGTYYGSWLPIGANAYSHIMSFSDGTALNVITMYRNNSATLMAANISVGGATQSGLSQTTPTFVGSSQQGAASYKVGSSGVSFNGLAANTGTPALLPTCTTFRIGNGGSGSNSGEIYNGWIKKISYYPQAVTSAQLQALTGS